MKNVFFALAFMLIGTFTFANTSITKVESEFFGCTSETVTTTTTEIDGSSSSTSTTTVNCDTAQELARYHKLMQAPN